MVLAFSLALAATAKASKPGRPLEALEALGGLRTTGSSEGCPSTLAATAGALARRFPVLGPMVGAARCSSTFPLVGPRWS